MDGLRKFQYNQVHLNSLVVVFHPSRDSAMSIVRKIRKRHLFNSECILGPELIGRPHVNERDKKQLDKTCKDTFASQGGESNELFRNDHDPPCYFLSRKLVKESILPDEIRLRINQFMVIRNHLLVFNHCPGIASPLSKSMKSVLFGLDQSQNRTCRIVTADPSVSSMAPKSVIAQAQFVFLFGGEEELSAVRLREIFRATGLERAFPGSSGANEFVDTVREFLTGRRGLVIYNPPPSGAPDRESGDNSDNGFDNIFDVTDRLFWTTDIERDWSNLPGVGP